MTNFRTSTALCGALTSLALAAPALAQDAQDLGTLYLNVNQTEIAAERSGTTVEVLTDEDLQDAPQTRLGDTLSALPGVTLSSNGGLGTSANLRVRGLGGSYVPVFIDGIDVTDPASSGQGFSWAGVTGLGYGRIELVKGSQSARFGMGAVGGVVNIQSTRATQDGTHVNSILEYGSFNTRKAGYGITSRTDRAEIALSFSHVKTDGFSARTAGTEDDGFEENRVNLYAHYDVTDNFRLGISGFWLDNRGEFDEWSGDGALPYDEYNETTAHAIRLFAELTTGAVDHSFSVQQYDTDRVSWSNGFSTPFEGTRKKAEYLGSWVASDRFTLNFGADWMREEAGANSAEDTGLFAEALFAPTDALDLAVSLRRDDHSNFGDYWSGRAALAWRIQPDLILRASASTGFRAPTLYQLTSVYGDPTFQPETSQSFDLGLEKQFGVGFVKATLFHTKIDGQVFWDGASVRCGSGFGCYETQDFTSKGLELSGEYDLSDRVTLTGSYTYTDATDAAGTKAQRVPEHDLELGLRADITDRLSMGVSVNHISERTDPGGTLGAYTLVNMNMGYQISDTAEAYLRVENLTDENYETSGGYGTSGRAAYFGIRANF